MLAPLAAKADELPLQITEGVGVTISVGFTVTVTTTCAEFVHVLVEPITVYVVDVGGVAVTTLPLVALKVKLGDQV